MAGARVRVLSVVLVTLALGGCSASVTVGGLDVDKAERQLKAEIQKQTGARVAEVMCPDGQKQEKGADFICRAVGTDDTKGDVTVTQTDDDGNVTYDAPFLHVREDESKIVAGIKQQNPSLRQVTVQCPEIIVARRGDTFTCQADADGSRAPVTATQTDSDGDFHYEVSGSPGG